ncbi:MAG: hypothetical protein WAV05_02770 [Anaerolineales bacterium]
MRTNFSLDVTAGRHLHDVSETLFGIFPEDINFSCDAGLNANPVNNSSFDGIYLNRSNYGEMHSFIFKPRPREVIDRL